MGQQWSAWVRALNHAKSFIFIFSLAESLGRFAVVHIPHLRIRVALTDKSVRA
jgi:hypothetical protein